MTERTRRTVCRLAFVALCALPTSTVVVWAAASHWPGATQRASGRLAAELDLAVSVEGASEPRPGVERFEQLTLSEPETGREILRLRSLDVIHRSDATLLVASQGELFATQLPALWQLVGARLRTEHVSDRPPLRLVMSGLTLHGVHQGQTLTSISGEIERVEKGARGALRLQLAQENVGDPVRLSIERRAEQEKNITRFELHTANRPLPLAPLAELVPALAHLGQQATFSGVLWAEQVDGDWRGELTGIITQVDLDAFITRQFPHKLAGIAMIRVEKARLQGGRLAAASLSIVAGPGVIENSLIDAAVEHAGLRRPGGMAQTDRFVAYDRLALALDLNSNQLTLRGECESVEPGAVLVGRDAVLLTEPEEPASNVLGLVRMLAPRGDLQVPASAETHWLLNRAPLPTAKPTPAGDAPKARVRFADE